MERDPTMTRKEGDFIHDLLLPDVLTLTFTPEDIRQPM